MIPTRPIDGVLSPIATGYVIFASTIVCCAQRVDRKAISLCRCNEEQDLHSLPMCFGGMGTQVHGLLGSSPGEWVERRVRRILHLSDDSTLLHVPEVCSSGRTNIIAKMLGSIGGLAGPGWARASVRNQERCKLAQCSSAHVVLYKKNPNPELKCCRLLHI
eukprot:1151182-Pelagomonas_calceolata.AAC.9